MSEDAIQFLPVPSVEVFDRINHEMMRYVGLLTGTALTHGKPALPPSNHFSWDVATGPDMYAFAQVHLDDDGQIKYTPIDPKDFYAS